MLKRGWDSSATPTRKIQSKQNLNKAKSNTPARARTQKDFHQQCRVWDFGATALTIIRLDAQCPLALQISMDIRECPPFFRTKSMWSIHTRAAAVCIYLYIVVRRGGDGQDEPGGWNVT